MTEHDHKKKPTAMAPRPAPAQNERPIPAPPIARAALRTPGQPLDAATRELMEPRFGRDFGDVRVHADARAAEAAEAVNALAYTAGQDVVFGTGQYAPGTSAGQALIAHELAHVAEQAASGAHNIIQTKAKRATGIEAPAENGSQPTEKDYADAQTHVTDFYTGWRDIHTSLVRASHRAINSFTQNAGEPIDRLGANIAYQMIRIVLGVVPGMSSVTTLFDKLVKGQDLAIAGSRLAAIVGVVAQRTAAGVYTATGGSSQGDIAVATVEAIDSLSDFDTKGVERISKEHKRYRAYVTQIGKQKTYEGRVLSVVVGAIGPLPLYDASAIQHFEKQYELELYRRFYRERGYVHAYESDMWGLHSQEIRGVPPLVQQRVLKLLRDLGQGKDSRDIQRYLELRREVSKTPGKPW